MTEPLRSTLDEQISEWRMFVRRRTVISDAQVDELETHLRDEVSALTDVGLAVEEAFLVAVKRLGSLDALSREFAREHSDRLWKQLVIGPDAADAAGARARTTELRVVVGLAIAAGVAIKTPELFGVQFREGNEGFYVRNISLFVLPLLTAYFAWKRGLSLTPGLRLSLPFVIAAAFANAYPFVVPRSDTAVLTALHLPIALWLVVGLAYIGLHWSSGNGRMDFVRFSGELFIYYVLIALGGGVLTMFTMLVFNSIRVNPAWFVTGWLLPCGAMGAVIIGSWLVEAKQSVIENMAPVLTRLFTPMFTLVLLAFLGTMAWTGNPIDIQREVLIAFDLLLALVVGLALYAASARDRDAPPDFFDRLQLVLLTSALVVDAVALAAIGSRISEFGFTPNRVAALGENLILLVSLAGSALLYVRFLRGHVSFAILERWQLAYLPVYSVWAAVVVVVFPPMFGFH